MYLYKWMVLAWIQEAPLVIACKHPAPETNVG